MSQFTTEDVLRLARLARVALTPEEVAVFAPQLSNILEFAAQVQAVDTSNLPASPRTVGAAPPREDCVEPSLSRDEVLGASQGADVHTGLITVPRVLAG